MNDKDIFSELKFLTGTRDNDAYVSKWKLTYLGKYLDFWNVTEFNEHIESEPGEYIKMDWFYWNFSLSEEWEYFIRKFDNSKSAKLDNYLWKYPNISKLFYILLWIVIWLIPTVIIFLT